MKKYLLNNKREIFWIIGIMISYIAIRSLHFYDIFNFSSEQASFSLKALELWKTKKIELIGPPISWRYEGRYFFQGSITFYMMIPFLLLGAWDPVKSSYGLVLFGALMAVVLYKAVSLLISRKAALLATLLFTFLPFYIDYSRFFWNPNLQFLVSPLVLLWMGLYQKTKKATFLFLVSFTSGALMLFHYQFFIVIVGILFYYLWIKKVRGLSLLIFLLGFPLGFSPLIIFELRNKFYNLQTLWLFLQHKDTVFPKGGHIFDIFTSYYMLCPSLYAIVAFSGLIKKRLNMQIILVIAAVLMVWALILYIPAPSRAFGMAKNWNYSLELKAFSIIKSQNITNFNIVNLGYDTIAIVQKYMLTKDGINGNWEDYRSNKYLFLITNTQDYMRNPAYEINTFTPNIVLRKWVLNDTYTMYLLERKSL